MPNPSTTAPATAERPLARPSARTPAQPHAQQPAQPPVRPARRRPPARPAPPTTRLTTPRTALLLVGALAAALTGCGATGGSDSSGAAEKPAIARQDGAAPGDGSREGAAAADGKAAPPNTGTGRTGTGSAPKLAAPSHIIRTATLTVRVKDVPTALTTARTAAENAGGYVGDETTDRDGSGHEQSRVVLRVPQAEYDSVLEALSGTGELIERKVNAQDVTDQVVDVESRVKSQRASVARVRELMDQATQLSDVVTLEGELSNRQAELEALEAQLKSLEERASMSTITLVLSETTPRAKPKEDEDPGFLDALEGGWDAFVATVRWIAVVIGAVLPFAVAFALLALIGRAVRSRLPRRGSAPETDRDGEAAPVPPAAPAHPDDRTRPDDRAHPDAPAHPGNRTHPDTPAYPDDRTRPDDRAHPDAPAHPAAPAYPAAAAVPAPAPSPEHPQLPEESRKED
ncbi:DUF4349 domain-containing protein [Streptomyces pathocidini]|uniref:DUF4349 domain-containing protein n=1 Tax=Streptomyces pathocidini TaxID=1650571 RepID=UPI003F4D4EAD